RVGLALHALADLHPGQQGEVGPDRLEQLAGGLAVGTAGTLQQEMKMGVGEFHAPLFGSAAVDRPTGERRKRPEASVYDAPARKGAPSGRAPTLGYPFFSTIQTLRNWSGLPCPCNWSGPGVPSGSLRAPPVLPLISASSWITTPLSLMVTRAFFTFFFGSSL